jgi:drug/metabolite transporter (DMT)-like permease
VIGVPTLTAIALDAKTSAHVAVMAAVLPAATAVMAVLRAGERPSPLGWAAFLLGESVTVGTVATAVAVLACVVATQRAHVEPAPGD